MTRRLTPGLIETVPASVRHGVVTLTGAVANPMRRIAIEQAVSNLPGVEDVRDNIHVARP